MFTSLYVHKVNICRHASLDSSLFIRKMLVAARAHYFHCQKVSPLLYFEFAMDGLFTADDNFRNTQFEPVVLSDVHLKYL